MKHKRAYHKPLIFSDAADHLVTISRRLHFPFWIEERLREMARERGIPVNGMINLLLFENVISGQSYYQFLSGAA